MINYRRVMLDIIICLLYTVYYLYLPWSVSTFTWCILHDFSLTHVDTVCPLVLVSLDSVCSDLVEGLTRLFSLTVHQLLSGNSPQSEMSSQSASDTPYTSGLSSLILGNGLLIHDNVITRSRIKTQSSTLNLIYSSQSYRPPEGWDRRIISHLCRTIQNKKMRRCVVDNDQTCALGPGKNKGRVFILWQLNIIRKEY